jgi:acyl-coenzyme A synthetase/AMP-(fatty) acid ligase
MTGTPLGEAVRPGSMGLPLPGVRLWVDEGELVADPATVPTFFLGYLGEDPAGGDRAADGAVWRTGDRVHQDEDGYLFFEGRTDDVIISAGYRIGPFEVESALVAHPAVAEAAVVAAPDEERGAIVRAVVVLRDGHAPSDALAKELQDHVKAQTAPYKYPRRIDWADALPRTSSGKVRRAMLRDAG